VIGNPTHDLVRLGLSLASAARGSDLPGVTTARILKQIIEGYAAAMEPGQTGDEGDEVPDEKRSRQPDAGRGSIWRMSGSRISNRAYLWVRGSGLWLPKSDPKSRICSKRNMFANSLRAALAQRQCVRGHA
jgi:hypothetical protein